MTVQVLNPSSSQRGAIMAKKSKKSGSARGRKARGNPSDSGSQGGFGKKVGMTAAAAIGGGLVTLVGARALAMKNAQGVPRLTAGKQTAVMGGVALGLAAGAAAVKNPTAKAAMAASAVVMGGVATIGAAHSYGVTARLDTALNPPRTGAAGYLSPGGDAMPYYLNPQGAYAR